MSLIFSILIAQAVGIIGSIFTAPNIKNWYIYLSKPSWSPPNWLFAPTWILLYTLMGVAAYLVWKKRKKPQVKRATKIIAISQSTKKDLIKLYGVHKNKIKVVYAGTPNF